MRINFQQGIIRYPRSGTLQQFLTKNGTNVNLNTVNGTVDVAFAHGSSHYLLSETADITSAWTGIAPNTDTWLYWDINKQTGVRTFGKTTVSPVSGSLTPTSPTEGLHWFDTVNKKMYAYQSGSFREVIRVFAAKVFNSTFTPMGSSPSPNQYAGSQVGLTNIPTAAGRILYDGNGAVIRKNTSGEFFTTEDEFYINGSPVNAVRFESGVVVVTAAQTVAKFQVVKFTDFGEIRLAGYDDTSSTAIAMTVEDILINGVGTCIIQGVITNPDWNWSTVGAELWVLENGLLTDADPHVTNPTQYTEGRAPIGRVLSQTSIIFDQGLGAKGERGPQGVQGNSGTVGDINLNDLTDVTIATPSAGQTIIYNGSQWLNQTAVTNLNGLTDVVLTSPSTGEVLTYNGSEWINLASSTGGGLTVQDTAPSLPHDNDFWWDSSSGNLFVQYEDVDSTQWVSASPANVADVYTPGNLITISPGPDKTLSVSNITISDSNVIIQEPPKGTPAVNVVGAIIIGDSAGDGAITDTNNILVGTQTGKGSTLSNQNILIGPYVGINTTAGSDNIFIGTQTGSDGFAPVTVGSNNILLGTQAGYTQAIGSVTPISNHLIINNETVRPPNLKPPFIIGDMSADTLAVNALMSTPFLPVGPNDVATKAYVDSVGGGGGPSLLSIPLHVRVQDLSSYASPGTVVAMFIAGQDFTITPESWAKSQAKMGQMQGQLILAVYLNDDPLIGSIVFNSNGVSQSFFPGYFLADGLLSTVGDISIAAGDVIAVVVNDNSAATVAQNALITLNVCHQPAPCNDGILVQWSRTEFAKATGILEYTNNDLTISLLGA